MGAGTERSYRVKAEVVMYEGHYEAKTKEKPASRERRAQMGGRRRANEKRESLAPGVTSVPTISET